MSIASLFQGIKSPPRSAQRRVPMLNVILIHRAKSMTGETTYQHRPHCPYIHRSLAMFRFHHVGHVSPAKRDGTDAEHEPEKHKHWHVDAYGTRDGRSQKEHIRRVHDWIAPIQLTEGRKKKGSKSKPDDVNRYEQSRVCFVV